MNNRASQQEHQKNNDFQTPNVNAEAYSFTHRFSLGILDQKCGNK